MSDEASPLPWSPQQWASLRAVAQESARNSRVATSFLQLSGPLARDQTTVTSLWMDTHAIDSAQRGEAKQRLEVRDGKTLHLTTISANVYLRGADVADPNLEAAKSMVRRAAGVLGRLEDAIIFNGIPEGQTHPTYGSKPVVEPLIYTVSGGLRKTGLLNAPDVLVDEQRRESTKEMKKRKEDAVAKKDTVAEGLIDAEIAKAEGDAEDSILCVDAGGSSNIVEAIVEAVGKLESRGQFGPFAVVLGHKLFKTANTPTSSLVLPSDRFIPFLDGGPFLRSGTLPADEGVVVALAGAPVELVVGTDMEVSFLQVTLEPRYVLRVYERFMLRVKHLDAICRISTAGCAWKKDRI